MQINDKDTNMIVKNTALLTEKRGHHVPLAAIKFLPVTIKNVPKQAAYRLVHKDLKTL